MEAERFDRLTRTLARPDTRRGLVRLLMALPLGMSLAALLAWETTQADGSGAIVGGGGGRRHRRVVRNRRQSGKDQDNAKDKNRKSKRKKRDKRPDCTRTSCAAQGATCGSIDDRCGGMLNCGSCPTCQTCSGGTCVTAANGMACGERSPGATLRCCDGACPAPTCLARSTPCNLNDCFGACCSGLPFCTQPTACVCGARSVAQPSRSPCASDNDCQNPSGTAQCICGTCCVPSGSAKRSDLPCSVCCSGSCTGDLCH